MPARVRVTRAPRFRTGTLRPVGTQLSYLARSPAAGVVAAHRCAASDSITSYSEATCQPLAPSAASVSTDSLPRERANHPMVSNTWILQAAQPPEMVIRLYNPDKWSSVSLY